VDGRDFRREDGASRLSSGHDEWCTDSSYRHARAWPAHPGM